MYVFADFFLYLCALSIKTWHKASGQQAWSRPLSLERCKRREPKVLLFLFIVAVKSRSSHFENKHRLRSFCSLQRICIYVKTYLHTHTQDFALQCSAFEGRQYLSWYLITCPDGSLLSEYSSWMWLWHGMKQFVNWYQKTPYTNLSRLGLSKD